MTQIISTPFPHEQQNSQLLPTFPQHIISSLTPYELRAALAGQQYYQSHQRGTYATHEAFLGGEDDDENSRRPYQGEPDAPIAAPQFFAPDDETAEADAPVCIAGNVVFAPEDGDETGWFGPKDDSGPGWWIAAPHDREGFCLLPNCRPAVTGSRHSFGDEDDNDGGGCRSVFAPEDPTVDSLVFGPQEERGDGDWNAPIQCQARPLFGEEGEDGGYRPSSVVSEDMDDNGWGRSPRSHEGVVMQARPLFGDEKGGWLCSRLPRYLKTRGGVSLLTTPILPTEPPDGDGRPHVARNVFVMHQTQLQGGAR